MIYFAISLRLRVASFYVESNGIFQKISITINKDLFTNKVNCAKQKNIKIYKDTKILRSSASRIVQLYKLSQKLWNKLISFAQLKNMKKHQKVYESSNGLTNQKINPNKNQKKIYKTV